MEEVKPKVRWEVRLRAAKHIPPSWPAYREIDNVISEIIDPIDEQLEEDAKWKE